MSLYHYRAEITRVIDGDTVVADVDLGMGVWKRGLRLRLYGVNTPEIRGNDRVAGMEARKFLERTLNRRVVTVQTYKDKTGKYGRYVVTLYADGENVNDLIVRLGHGVAA